MSIESAAAATELLAGYGGWRGRTRRDHRAQVLARLGWRGCGTGERKLLDEFLLARALEHDAPDVPLGMGLAVVGLVWLTRLGLSSGYAADVLPPLVVAGLGISLVMAPAMNVAAYGVQAHDAGVASAAVNAMQQIGGSIGIALLSTFAGTAASRYLTGKNPANPLVQAQRPSTATRPSTGGRRPSSPSGS